MEVKEELAKRDIRYGSSKFYERAKISQIFKNVVRERSIGWENLSLVEQEALDMIFHKIARIVGGEQHRKDSWLDLAGYAELVLREEFDNDG